MRGGPGEVTTRRGGLRYHADLDPSNADRPAILYIGGLSTTLARPPVPDHDLVMAALVGVGADSIRPCAPREFHEVYEDLIAAILPGRAVVACGGSSGAIPVLGLTAPEVRVKVALDPALTSNWALTEQLRAALQRRPDMEAYFFELFGVGLGRTAMRDYTDLLAGLNVPLHVVLASEPLRPPRPGIAFPSMTGEAERALLRAHRLVTIHETPPGTSHDWTLTPGGRAAVARALRQALAEAAQLGAA